MSARRITLEELAAHKDLVMVHVNSLSMLHEVSVRRERLKAAYDSALEEERALLAICEVEQARIGEAISTLRTATRL